MVSPVDDHPRASTRAPRAIIDWALYYAETLGWAVFPVHSVRQGICSCGSAACTSPGKHPRTRAGVKDATAAPEAVRAWWRRWPDANIGIATGRASGLLVIDIDPRHYGDESYADLLSEAGLDRLPDSLQCLTGGGGWHDYFRIPIAANVRNAANVRGHQGVDIRGTGGYVIAPPSIHVSGGAYLWEMESDPTQGAQLADCPEPLLKLLSGQQPRLTSLPRRQRPDRGPHGKVPEGGRNNDLAGYLGGLRAHGADLDELVRRGTEYSDAHHDPPLSSAEILRTAQSIARYPVRRDEPPPPPPWVLEDDIPPPTDADAPPEIVGSAPSTRPARRPVERTEISLSRTRDQVDPDARRALVAWLTDQLEATELREHPRQLWLRGSQLVTIAQGADALVLSPATPDQVHDALCHCARWIRLHARSQDSVEARPADPPKDLAHSIHDTPPLAVPALEWLAPIPTYGADGTYLARLGYHARDRVWRYGMDAQPIEDVSASAAWHARDAILDLIADFGFRSDADRAALLAYWIVPHMRRMIDGAVPMTVFSSPKNGVGKSLLAELGQILYLGHSAGAMPLSRRDEEIRKTVTSVAIAGNPYLFFDNVSSAAGLQSPSLAAALTATVWHDRVLGRTETVAIPVSWIPVATIAGGTYSTEIARRAVVCELVADCERPWERRGFRFPDIRRHVAHHRHELVRAIHTMIGAWIQAGSPQADITLGSYEAWASQMGGLLEWLGIPGLLQNAERIYETSDMESESWRQIVDIWAEEIGTDRAATVRDLYDALDARGVVPYLDLGRDPRRTLRRRLAAQRGGVVAGYRIEQSPDWRAGRAMAFRIVECKPANETNR